jgi:hypothetical protein
VEWHCAVAASRLSAGTDARPHSLSDAFIFLSLSFSKKVTKEIARIKMHLLVG